MRAGGWEGAYGVAQAVEQLEPVGSAVPALAEGSEVAEIAERFKAAARRLVDLLQVRPPPSSGTISASVLKLMGAQARMPAMSRLGRMIEATPTAMLCDLVRASPRPPRTAPLTCGGRAQFVMAIDATYDERLAVLNEHELSGRFAAGLALLERQLLVLSAASQLGDQSDASKALLRGSGRSRAAPDDEAAAAGAEEEEETAHARLTRLVAEAQLPPEAAKACARELRKLKDMERSQNLGPEHQKTVTYLEWMAELPWSKASEHAEPDMGQARTALDADHYGLEKIKRRILEYVAVRWLNPGTSGTILCLVGPPGVGKTSLGRSIAATLGRTFQRIALGGVRDEVPPPPPAARLARRSVATRRRTSAGFIAPTSARSLGASCAGCGGRPPTTRWAADGASACSHRAHRPIPLR